VPGRPCGDHGKRRSIEAVTAAIARSNGRRYRLRLELLDAARLVELVCYTARLDERAPTEVAQGRLRMITANPMSS